MVAKELGLIERILSKGIKAFDSDKLNSPGMKPVAPEQMKPARVPVEILRPKLRDKIIK